MTTKHLVDPELEPLIGLFPKLTLTKEALAETRASLAQGMAQAAAAAPAFPTVERTDRKVPGLNGAPDVRVLVYRPTAKAKAPVPALVWIHGGGYVLGTAEIADINMKSLVAELGCMVVSVDYRLAPETPHPGPVEDCYAALKWTASAGGGLAAALGLLARDRREVAVAFQLLIYPMLDDRTVTTPNPHPHTGEFVWTPEANHFGWQALLGKEPGSRGISQYAAPARAEDLGGLPPTYIDVGSLDLFLEEDLEYARRLLRAGVPTELHVYPGAFHGYPMMEAAHVAKQHNRDHIAALKRALRL